MSDNIPFEVQVEIIKRLPVKSMFQFRSVSKDWKSLIDSSGFTAQYNSGHYTNPQHLLLRYDYDGPIDNEHKYVSIVDDDTVPRQKASLAVPRSVKMVKDSSVIGICNGVVCLYGDYERGRRGQLSGTGRAVLWNPSIRKTVSLVVPNVAYGLQTFLGFGVCRETNDPKIVKITYKDSRREPMKSIPGQVEVFRLSTGVWRNQYSNLPRKSIRLCHYKEAINGSVYWLATDTDNNNYNLITSFDMTNEEFSEVDLPDNLTHTSEYNLSMSKLMKSLVVLESDIEADDQVFSVWMMEEDSAKKYFTKLYTINNTYMTVNVSCFRRTDEPILDVVDGIARELAVYEPRSKRITNLGIKGGDDYVSISVYPYMETLHLLHEPAFIYLDKGKQYVSKWRGKRRRPLE